MDLTAHDVRSAHFSGTRHVYDRREVDGYLIRLADALERYENELGASRRRLRSLEQALESAQHRIETAQHEVQRAPQAAPSVADTSDELRDLQRRAFDLKTDALAEAASIRRRAEEDAAEMANRIREEAVATEGAGPDEADLPSLDETTHWIQLLVQREQAASFVDAAREDSKRIREIAEEVAVEGVADAARDKEAVAAALAVQIEARRVAAENEVAKLVEHARIEGSEIVAGAQEAAAEQARRLLDETERLASQTRDSAQREAEAALGDAKTKSETLVAQARRDAAQATERAQREVRAMERRVRQIRSSLRDAESRFKSLTASTTAEFSMLGDVIDLDVEGGAEALEPIGETVVPPAPAPADEADSSPGFYERRLAGLRSRIEASANTADDPHR